mgnify:CR=1 FL=1
MRASLGSEILHTGQCLPDPLPIRSRDRCSGHLGSFSSCMGEVGHDAGHEVVDGGVGFGGGGEDLLFGLNEGGGLEFVPAMMDERAGGFGRGFEMKLESDDAIADLEGLIGAGGSGGEMDGVGREIEGFTVPVESEGGGWEGEGGRMLVVDGVDGKPSNFFLGAGIDAGSEGGGDQLSAEANAEDGFAVGDEAADEGFFVDEPRVDLFVVHAHGSTEEDEKVDGLRMGQGGGLVETGDGVGMVVGGEPGFDAGGAFEGDVLEDGAGHEVWEVQRFRGSG